VNLLAGLLFDDLTAKEYELRVYVSLDTMVNWQKDYTLEDEDIEFYDHLEVLRGEMVPANSVIISENEITNDKK